MWRLFASGDRSAAVFVRRMYPGLVALAGVRSPRRVFSFVLGWARALMGSAGAVGLRSLLHHARAAASVRGALLAFFRRRGSGVFQLP